MRPIILMLALALAGCGESTAKIDVNLRMSGLATLNPFGPTTGISKVRVTIATRDTGPEDEDSATIDLPVGTTNATFEKFPTGVAAEVRCEGVDDFGNVIAFGKAENLQVDGDLSLEIPFRRNLAYVIHEANSRQAEPGRHIYVIDVATRTFVEKLQIPGTAPIARGITARDGESLLVTYSDSGQGFIAELSADTHEFRSVPLMQVQDRAVASADGPIAVVAGGQLLSFVNLESGQVLGSMPVGGEIQDMAMAPGGKRAFVVLDTAALDVDVEKQEAKRLELLSDPCGVAIGLGGNAAYLVSGADGSVAAIDLQARAARVVGAFPRPACGAAYSDEIESVFAVSTDPGNGSGRIVEYNVVANMSGPQIQTLNFPADIASDAAGRRVIAVAAGTSSATAGLTVVDTYNGLLPDGSSSLYPLDPDDTFTSPGGAILRQRWQPRGVAVIYGR